MVNTALTALALQALELALVLTLPALLAALAAGVLTGIVQTATAVQDPALAFVPRLLAVGAALWATSAAMGERLTQFASHVLNELPKLAL
jgi:type III secretory pathway component EscS